MPKQCTFLRKTLWFSHSPLLQWQNKSFYKCKYVLYSSPTNWESSMQHQSYIYKKLLAASCWRCITNCHVYFIFSTIWITRLIRRCMSLRQMVNLAWCLGVIWLERIRQSVTLSHGSLLVPVSKQNWWLSSRTACQSSKSSDMVMVFSAITIM